MAPAPPPGEVKLEDIDFDRVKECKNYKVIKTYIKLLEDDGSYFEDLLRACKSKLLELNPKEYYVLYPQKASEDEVMEATKDILEWEAAVKETDASLKKSKQTKIWAETPAVAAPIRGQEAVISRPNLQKTLEDNGTRNSSKKEDVYARDKSAMKEYYRAWDSVDVDAMEAELDEEETREEESRRRHFQDLKDQQDEAHKMTPVEVGNLPSGVPEAHRRHMADSEKEKGNEAFYAKDWEEAEAYYSRSLHFGTDDPSTWANRALVRLKLEKAAAALQDCDHALELNPRYMKALHRKGKALHELKRYEEAVRCFQLALAESPGNTQINGDLMVSRRHLRDPPPASKPKLPNAPSSCIIEELDDDDDSARAESSNPAPGYTRVAIEEDSDSEEEEEKAAPAATSSTGTRGFTKVAIEEVSGSEDEEEPAQPAAGRIQNQDIDGDFQYAGRFMGARPGFVFKTGPKGLGYYRDPAVAAPRSPKATPPGRPAFQPPSRTAPQAAAPPTTVAPKLGSAGGGQREAPADAAAAASTEEAKSAVCFDDMD